jgi:predicted transcriptional regulator
MSSMVSSSDNAIILSIKPKYAEAILAGIKRVELRRTRPQRLSEGGVVLLYATSPARRFVGGFRVGEIRQECTESLWQRVGDICSVSRDEYLSYYDGVDEGVALFVSGIWRLKRPMDLRAARKRFPGFAAPRSFRYATALELAALGEGCVWEEDSQLA